MEINGKSYRFKYSLRAMFVFEEIANKPFEVKTLLDTYIFAYSCLVSNQDNPPIEFNEFIDYCENHQEVMEEFNVFMEEENKKRIPTVKKKVTRKVKNSQ